MENISNILVITRMTQQSEYTLQCGVSLARRYDAKLHVLHLVSNPVDMVALNAPGLFPEEYTNYMFVKQAANEQLDNTAAQQTTEGFPIHELVGDSDSVDEIVKAVNEEKIDLLVMPAHEEGLLENALFGGENDAIIRRMPCSILLVKNSADSSDNQD